MKPYSLRSLAVRWACALHARFMRASCAGHSFRALPTRCAFAGFFNMCALCALWMRTVYEQRVSNTLCMRCQLASFSQILTKVGRTTTYWSNFSYFYARTVRRVCVTGLLRRGAGRKTFLLIFQPTHFIVHLLWSVWQIWREKKNFPRFVSMEIAAIFNNNNNNNNI